MTSAEDAGGDDSSPKYVFTITEENKMRRRLIWSAMVFNALCAAFALQLCVGVWPSSGAGSGLANTESRLITWSTDYRGANDSAIVSISWSLSSICFSSNVEMHAKSGNLSSCVSRSAGVSFHLQDIMDAVDERVRVEERTLRRPGSGVGQYNQAESLDNGIWAIIMYGATLAAVVMVWIYDALAKLRVVYNRPRFRHLKAIIQGFGAIGIVIPAAILTAASRQASTVLDEYPELSGRQTLGTSALVIGWSAAASQALAAICYSGAVQISHRILRRESPDIELVSRPRASRNGHGQRPENTGSQQQDGAAGWDWHGRHHAQRLERPGVHREHDGAEDDDLPPYSRSDPLTPSATDPRSRRRGDEEAGDNHEPTADNSAHSPSPRPDEARETHHSVTPPPYSR